MNKILLALALATVAATGCRAQHLGPRQGQAYRKAFGHQLANKGKPPANQDAADAKRVLTVHRTGGQQSAPPAPTLPPLVLTGGH